MSLTGAHSFRLTADHADEDCDEHGGETPGLSPIAEMLPGSFRPWAWLCLMVLDELDSPGGLRGFLAPLRSSHAVSLSSCADESVSLLG